MARDIGSFDCLPSSVTHARHSLVQFLEAEGCADRGADTAALLVSELATNAVRHAHTGFTLGIRHDAGTLEVEVADDDPTEPRRRTPDDEGGRGLADRRRARRRVGHPEPPERQDRVLPHRLLTAAVRRRSLGRARPTVAP